MSAIQIVAPDSGLLPVLRFSPELSRPRWYAVHTYSRHERRVAQFLRSSEVECFLPLYRSVRRWKDRQKQTELPLFPGYLFVRIPLERRMDVLIAPGVANVVSFGGKPVPLADSEIESLRSSVAQCRSFEPHPYLKVGKRVRVSNGVMIGLEGILVRRKEKLRLVLSIELIMRSVAIEVDEADVEPAS